MFVAVFLSAGVTLILVLVIDAFIANKEAGPGFCTFRLFTSLIISTDFKGYSKNLSTKKNSYLLKTSVAILVTDLIGGSFLLSPHKLLSSFRLPGLV